MRVPPNSISALFARPPEGPLTRRRQSPPWPQARPLEPRMPVPAGALATPRRPDQAGAVALSAATSGALASAVLMGFLFIAGPHPARVAALSGAGVAWAGLGGLLLHR